jgi:hypothetical protein
MPEMPELLKCPLFLYQSIKAKSGETICQECHSQFEIEPRMECVFGDTNDIRLQAIDTIYTTFCIIQAGLQ